MDHVRGSSLVWPATLELLRPFIVTWWSGRNVDDMPADIKAVYDDCKFPRMPINIALVVLDEHGKHLRASRPVVKPGAMRFDPESQGKDFKRQLDEMLLDLDIPKATTAAQPKLTLPEVCGKGKCAGVRIYLTAEDNRLRHYRTPIVEAVPVTESIAKALRYPKASTTLPAKDLMPWLEQIYPAAIMDGKGGFRSIDGPLTLKPAGSSATHRFAIVEGELQFELDNSGRTSYGGDLAIVLKYPLLSNEMESLRGVCDFTVPTGTEKIRIHAAIETTPE
jgi:hypothetical protein